MMQRSPSVLSAWSRLSHSSLYTLQRQHARCVGEYAFTDSQTPSLITNNALLANQITGAIIAALSSNDTRTLTIVEIGAGYGKLSFLVLQQLNEAFHSQWPKGLRYVISDISASSIHYCLNHSKFQYYIDNHILDFAIVDNEDFDALDLIVSHDRIDRRNAVNEMMVVATYTLSSMTHDAFQLVDGRLYEGLIQSTLTDTDSVSGIDAYDYDLLSDDRLQHHWQYKEAIVDSQTGDYHYYTGDETFLNPILNSLLRHYRQHCDNAKESDSGSSDEYVFLFPIGALKCFQSFRSLTSSHLHCLIVDKGSITLIDSLDTESDTVHFAYHGSFSVMTNLFALQYYFPHFQCSHNTDAAIKFVLGSVATPSLALLTAFQSFNHFSSPLLLTIDRILRHTDTGSESGQRLSLHLDCLRMSCYDYDIFLRHASAIETVLNDSQFQLTKSLLQQLQLITRRVANNYFPRYCHTSQRLFAAKTTVRDPALAMTRFALLIGLVDLAELFCHYSESECDITLELLNTKILLAMAQRDFIGAATLAAAAEAIDPTSDVVQQLKAAIDEHTMQAVE